MLFNQNIANINELESVAPMYLYQKNSQNGIKTTVFSYIFAESKFFGKPAAGVDFGGVFKEFFEFSKSSPLLSSKNSEKGGD